MANVCQNDLFICFKIVVVLKIGRDKEVGAFRDSFGNQEAARSAAHGNATDLSA